MLRVVADTSPIRYLVQIGSIEILAQLFEKVKLPFVVAGELTHPSAPAAVRAWMTQLPGWAEVDSVPDLDDEALELLDPGERSAIVLALSLKADLILMDDPRGAAVARKHALEVAGTLGVLELAAERGMVDLKDLLNRLAETNFRYRPELFAALLKKHERTRSQFK